MLLTLGEQKILSLNDFADLASDELIGGFDIIKGERIKIKGYLEDFALSRKEADVVFLGAWNFKQEILKKEKKFRKEGGKFLIHVPKVKLIWIIDKYKDI